MIRFVHVVERSQKGVTRVEDPHNHPFYEVVASAQAVIEKGGTVYQKWTCRVCDQRLTMDTPDAFYKVGVCEECGSETDLVATGCNFIAVYDKPRDRVASVTDPRD